MWYEIDGIWNSKVEEKLQKYWYIERQSPLECIHHIYKNQPNKQKNPSLEKALFYSSFMTVACQLGKFLWEKYYK